MNESIILCLSNKTPTAVESVPYYSLLTVQVSIKNQEVPYRYQYEIRSLFTHAFYRTYVVDVTNTTIKEVNNSSQVIKDSQSC